MTRWYQERKHEHFYKEAKRAGYRARSAYKLKQIQKKYSLLSPGDLVVDLGAAPGGWSQVAHEIVGEMGRVIGVDLSPIKPMEQATFFQGDITKQETREALLQLLENKKADVVLSDMSPDISGTYSVDQARSIWLCEQALTIAETILRPGGHFLCKIFEGEDTQAFLNKVKSCFYIVKRFSPKASRKSSSEFYCIAKSLKK